MTLSGVNFINVLQAAFTCADPKGTKKTDNLTLFFALSGSVHVKTVHKRWVKFTPGSVVEPKLKKLNIKNGETRKSKLCLDWLLFEGQGGQLFLSAGHIVPLF